MANNIETLRDHLFKTLEALGDKEKSMEIDRAKAISDVAQTIINSAKVEVDFAKATGNKTGSVFLEKPSQLPPGITGVHQHRIK